MGAPTPAKSTQENAKPANANLHSVRKIIQSLMFFLRLCDLLDHPHMLETEFGEAWLKYGEFLVRPDTRSPRTSSRNFAPQEIDIYSVAAMPVAIQRDQPLES